MHVGVFFRLRLLQHDHWMEFLLHVHLDAREVAL